MLPRFSLVCFAYSKDIPLLFNALVTLSLLFGTLRFDSDTVSLISGYS